MKNSTYTDEMIARYFEGDLDDKEIERIENTIMDDKLKEQEMKDFARLWEKSAELGKFDKADLEKDWQNVRSRMGFKSARKISFMTYFPRIAAILVVAMGLTYFLSKMVEKVPAETQNEYIQVIAQGESKTIVLPDNSQVFLNKNARLVYNNDFGFKHRDIILEGEAFFEVSKNKALPFRVYTGSSTVEVLGTSFNIKPTAEKLIVSVLSGHVLFYETSKKDNKVELLANEQSVFNLKNGHFDAKSKVELNLIAWKTGLIVYEGEPLEQFFQTLALFYNLELVNTMEHPFNETINTGSFSADSVEKLIEDIQLTLAQEFNAEIKNGKLILSD